MIQEAPTDRVVEYVHIRFLRNGYRFTNNKEMSYIPYLKYCRRGEVLTKYWVEKIWFMGFTKLYLYLQGKGTDGKGKVRLRPVEGHTAPEGE